jgi:hypothetical protein
MPVPLEEIMGHLTLAERAEVEVGAAAIIRGYSADAILRVVLACADAAIPRVVEKNIARLKKITPHPHTPRHYLRHLTPESYAPPTPTEADIPVSSRRDEIAQL